jgi:hypothetical protein
MPIPEEELSPDVQNIVRRTHELRIENSETLARIEQKHASPEIAVARLEHFFEMLVDAGVITTEQMWAEHLSWEEHLRNQLLKLEDKIDQLIEQARSQQIQQQLAAGLSPSGSLIVPPGVKRSPHGKARPKRR